MPLACFSARNFVIREREKRLKSKGTTAVYGEERKKKEVMRERNKKNRGAVKNSWTPGKKISVLNMRGSRRVVFLGVVSIFGSL